jgi:hypothetical protein
MEELIQINEQSPKHFDNPKSINFRTIDFNEFFHAKAIGKSSKIDCFWVIKVLWTLFIDFNEFFHAKAIGKSSNILSMEELIEINEQSPKHFNDPKSINFRTLSNSLSMEELIEINEQSPKLSL